MLITETVNSRFNN